MIQRTSAQQVAYDQMMKLCQEFDPLSTDDDHAARFPGDKWRRVADSGLFAAPFMPDRREADSVLPELVGAMEALGHGCDDAGLVFSVATQLASSAIALSRFGSTDLRRRYEHEIGTGTVVGAHAITEPQAGSDALAMTTMAVRSGTEFVINGHKAFVSNGPIADLIVVYALTGEPGAVDGLTAFAVRRETEGLTVGGPLDTMGLRTSPLGVLELTGVRVSENDIVGQAGGGAWLLSHVMAREILLIGAAQVGQMQRRLDRVVERATGRIQFGRPIGAFQAVSHPLVDLRISVETARRWVYDLTARMTAGEDVTAEVAMAKVVVSEANVASARTAVQVFGGEGYLRSTGIERGLRDALAATIYSGTSETQRNKIAALMGLGEQRKGGW